MDFIRILKGKSKQVLERVFFLFANKVYSERIFSLYAKEKCKQEFENQTYCAFNERPIEYSFVFKQLTNYCPVNILDVGTGMTALPHLMRNCGFKVTAIDNVLDYWPKGMINRHFHVINDDITNSKLNQKFDLITCISTLEHIVNYDKAIENMFKLLNPEGKIILTFPYNEIKYCENVYALPDSPVGRDTYSFTTQAYSRKELDSWLTFNGGKILEQEYWRFFTGEYWTLGERISPPIKVSKDEKHQIICLIIKKNKC